MMALEVDQKFEDRPAENADTAELAHIGLDMDRIDALVRGVDTEYRSQFVGDGIEHDLVKVTVDHHLTHGVQCLLANVFYVVALFGDVERIMPLNIECQLFDGGLVGQVHGLLEK